VRVERLLDEVAAMTGETKTGLDCLLAQEV
jgi:hypothetical protein